MGGRAKRVDKQSEVKQKGNEDLRKQEPVACMALKGPYHCPNGDSTGVSGSTKTEQHVVKALEQQSTT